MNNPIIRMARTHSTRDYIIRISGSPQLLRAITIYFVGPATPLLGTKVICGVVISKGHQNKYIYGQEPTESSSPGQQSITDRPPEPRTRRIIINGWGDKTGSKNTRSLTQLIKITSSLTTRARSQYAVPLLGFYTIPRSQYLNSFGHSIH